MSLRNLFTNIFSAMPLLESKLIQDQLVITLNDESSRNAFSPEMAQYFSESLQSHTFSSVVLFAKGKTFCSGGNLSFYSQLKSKEEGLSHNQKISEILESFYKLPKPKACYVSGDVFGGGLELISCFDFIVSHPNSLFGLWQRRIGLTFGWGGGARLQRRISPQLLKSWLLSSKTFSAYQANKMGLVDVVALQENGKQLCCRWAQEVAELGEDNCQSIFRHGLETREAFEELWHSPLHQSYLKKFN